MGQKNYIMTNVKNKEKNEFVVYKSIAQAGEPSIAIRRQANMRGFRNNIFFAIILICLPECYTR